MSVPGANGISVGRPAPDAVSDLRRTGMENAMTKATLEIHDGSIFGLAAKRFELDCGHGQTSTVLLPGRGPHGYAAALEMLIVRHERQHGCACPRSVGPVALRMAQA